MDFSKLKIINNEDTLDRKTDKSDKKMMELMFALEKVKKDTRKREFQEWLNKDISKYMYNQETLFYVKDAINEILASVNTKLTLYGYTIKEQKAFRNEVASFMYRL